MCSLTIGEMDSTICIREFNEDSDIDLVEKLERDCDIGSRKGISIFTNIMGDPLCRIRLYPIHVMLVAELLKNRELVGVIRGCIKCVGTGLEGKHANIACILGLRVSPNHRRKGIGSKLVKSIEGWATQNGAEYIWLATEESNVASKNLFVSKGNYVKLSSLVIVVQPVRYQAKDPLYNLRIEKLSVQKALSLYRDRLGNKVFFPADIDVILNGNLSLGTWVSYFKEEDWVGLHSKEENDFTKRTPNSWAILSIWKSYEVYKLQRKRKHPFKYLHASLPHVGAKLFPCLTATTSLLHRPFGFLFLYGIYGEGERLGELMKSLWCFAYNLARNVKDCKAIITELGNDDPLREHIQEGTSTPFINDLWYFKNVNGSTDDNTTWFITEPTTNLFVDPRDF